MVNNSKVVDAVTMAFYNSNPYIVDRVWQTLFYVSGAACHHKGSNDFAFAHLGWEQPTIVQIHSRYAQEARMHIF